MIKNNKGFTVVEMGISFCLIFTICILLFQIILTVKDVYIRGNIETTLLSKQGILLNRIYKDLDSKGVSSVEAIATPSTQTSNYKFTFQDNTEAVLTFTELDGKYQKIQYDDYIWDISDNSIKTATNVEFIPSEVIEGKEYFSIRLDIQNDLTEDTNYGITIFHELTH